MESNVKVLSLIVSQHACRIPTKKTNKKSTTCAYRPLTLTVAVGDDGSTSEGITFG